MRELQLTVRSRFSLPSFICAALLAAGAQTALAGKNPPPTVTLTSPANGAGFIAPASIPLAATASDSNGTVVRVDFFSGTTLIGTSTTPPYTATWSNVPAGNYTLTAKATDNQGGTGTSAAVSITVATATSLVITNPADGAFVNISQTLGVTGTYEGSATGNTILVDDPSHSVLATISGNTYSASIFGGFTIGANSLTARIERADRSNVTRTITVFGYDTPVVAFTAPSTGSFTAPATVTFIVDAKAPGGSVTQVQFLRNGTPVGTVTAPPYQVTLNNLSNGNYTITANATSNRGPVGTSNSTIQILGPNTPPIISITSPASGTIFSAGSNVPITVNASDPDGTVTLVEYFANGGLISASNVSPFSFTWMNPAAGNYALTARATDNRSGQTTSAPVNITVAPPNNPPTATLTSPANGATFNVPAIVPLTATAADSDGTVTRVDYYQGNTLIGSATTPPYAFNWTAVAPGTYVLKARAVDNFNATGDSPTVTITVSGTITYLHNDFTGNPIAATDSNGALVWRENFRPYGDRLNNQGAASGNRQWFHGKAVDADTGLSYFGARYYDATIGRFMGLDAIGFKEKNPPSFNRYSYANNNPYRFLDPDGKWSTDAHNYFIDQAFGQMSDRVRNYMKEGSAAADATYNQVPGRDHIHSMWGSGGSQEQMQQRRREYIRERITNFSELMAKANEYRARGNTGTAEQFEARAWREYGQALHPIMDSTSPVHNQEWKPFQDWRSHGDAARSQETEAVARQPQYRDETVRRMRNLNEFTQ